MSFDVETGQASERGPRALNEDFAALRRARRADATEFYLLYDSHAG